ncbi:MAG: elongation factor P maturation arginine rhamnosyltransferase EarP [Candidatus Gracilibacteria bacterium]|nr:elongation factor P maturation arginine rhamnosyltransferase EarP [Candidatus Gracilibacteria bacterium]
MQIDFYTTIIDNYGDAGFSFNLAISLSYYYPKLKIRFFCDNEKIFLSLKGNKVFQNVKYFDLKDVSKYKSSKLIFNFFDKKIDFEFLHKFNYDIKLINFSYFLLHSGVGNLHNTKYNSKDIEVIHYIPSLLQKGGGIIINPYLEDFKNKINIKNTIKLKQELLPNLDKNLYDKKWISIFCYKETFENIKDIILNDKDNLYFVFDNNLSGENIINMGFLNILDYYKFQNLCDKNIVRGENSLINSILSGKPFLWDIYKENNSAHKEKIEDFSKYILSNFGDNFLDYLNIFKEFNIGNTKKGFIDFLNYENDFEIIKKDIFLKNNLINNLEKYLNQ